MQEMLTSRARKSCGVSLLLQPSLTGVVTWRKDVYQGTADRLQRSLNYGAVMNGRQSRRISETASLAGQPGVYARRGSVGDQADGVREREPLVDRVALLNEGYRASMFRHPAPPPTYEDSERGRSPPLSMASQEPTSPTKSIQKNIFGRAGPKQTRVFLSQFLASTAKNLIVLNMTMCMGFQALVVGAAMNAKDSLYMDQNLVSWFAGMISIWQPVGSLFSGPMVEYFGRKKSLMAVNIPFTAAWLLMYFASNPAMLFASAIITGICIGLQEAPAKTYSGEICQPKYRGTLSAYGGILFSLGFFIIFIMGACLPWRTTALIASGLPVISFLSIALIPDSPQWLVSKGRIRDAEEALCWLRGWTHRDTVQAELQQLISYNQQSRNSKEMMAIPSKDPKSKSKTGESLHENLEVEGDSWAQRIRGLNEPGTRRALILVLICMFLQVTASGMGIHTYIIHVSTKLKFPISGYSVLIATGVIGIITTLLMMFVIAKLGKRRLMLYSLAILFICNVLSGAYDIIDPSEEHANTRWIPLILYEVGVFCTNLSLAPIPWILVSEVFPFKTRGIASAICASCDHLMSFAATKGYLPLSGAIGLYGIFWIVAGISLFGFGYVFRYIPETEGRTLEEIEEYFKEGKRPNAQQRSMVDGSKA